MITVDSISKERDEIKQLFDLGEENFKNGTTMSEKEEALKFTLRGLKKLKSTYELIESRDPSSQIGKVLKTAYIERFRDLEKKINLLAYQKNLIITKTGGVCEKNDEEKRFQEVISEAITVEKQDIKWEDVAGFENAKKSLQEAVILPIKFPQFFVGARKPWKGILLYGPPGKGNKFLVKACAHESGSTLFSISFSDLISKYFDESERLINTLFKMAKEKRPAIIFVDEIDFLCESKSKSEGGNDLARRVKAEFLIQMQRIKKDENGLLVIGATNFPWMLDLPLRRPFERKIYIPLPDYERRLFLMRHHFSKTPNNFKEEDFASIAKEIEGFSGDDISRFIRDAVFEPVRKIQNAQYFEEVNVEGKIKFKPVDESCKSLPNVKKITLIELNQDELLIPEVSMDDITTSLLRSKPSMTSEQLKEYENFTSQFGEDG